MEQLKEQVYRAAAQAANDAVAALARYEGTETNLWSFIQQGEQDRLWKDVRAEHIGKKEEDLPDPNAPQEKEEYKKFRQDVTKLALAFLTKPAKKEPLTGGSSKPVGAGQPQDISSSGQTKGPTT